MPHPPVCRAILGVSACLAVLPALGQFATLRGVVTTGNAPVAYATIYVAGTDLGAQADTAGTFTISGLPEGPVALRVSAVGYRPHERMVTLNAGDTAWVTLTLAPDAAALGEIVVSGTLKPVSRLDSPVPVEVYSAAYFAADPTPNLYEALGQVNGVRPQLNCNVCNTGDIHINGMEGPYSLVLIDGMPLVSGLSTVYGLQGIPLAMIDRVEVVKGPASTLYGSEAVGGLINVITRSPEHAPALSMDMFMSSWGEINADIGGAFQPARKIRAMAGVNLFHFGIPTDHDGDGFTDIALQDRLSLFTKWSFARTDDRPFILGARYVHEDRWGGDIDWTPAFRGGDSLYGESIRTRRWEVFGEYRLPVSAPVSFRFSANGHDQNSAYGTTPFIARQQVLFGQLTWNPQLTGHDLLFGAAWRYTAYDDNTPATSGSPVRTGLPGVFIQDEWRMRSNHTLLTGLRYDHHSVHGNILTPRISYKWSSTCNSEILRFTMGSGYRVAQVFTEDHAALTGSREVVFREALRPETSWNANLNFIKKFFIGNFSLFSIDFTAFHTRFANKIMADYDADPDKIIYANLDGHGISRGLTLNLQFDTGVGLDIMLGGTYLDIHTQDGTQRARPLLTERFSGVWRVRYGPRRSGLTVDYTGSLYGPMQMPLAGPADPRLPSSPWWSHHNIQVTKPLGRNLEIYAGVKNLFNWTPSRDNPFLIARAYDPFDKHVQYGPDGRPLVLPDNPYGLTFDTAYAYAPNQGRRWFLGLRMMIDKGD